MNCKYCKKLLFGGDNPFRIWTRGDEKNYVCMDCTPLVFDEERRNKIQKLLEVEMKDMHKFYICTHCKNVVQEGKGEITAICVNDVDFLAVCSPCYTIEIEEKQLEKDREQLQKNKVRYHKMRAYLNETIV